MELKFMGIDLAGIDKRPTGICVLSVRNEEKSIRTKLLFTDEEIINEFISENPIIVAIDAPLSKGKFGSRKCDYELRNYGALPLTFKGMEKLAERGIRIRNILNSLNTNSKIIEVLAVATSKILGFYHKDNSEEQKRLMKIFSEIENKRLKKDEIDAIFCAMTAYLHYIGKTIEIGDDEGKILIPKI